VILETQSHDSKNTESSKYLVTKNHICCPWKTG